MILQRVEAGNCSLVGSAVLDFEIGRIADCERLPYNRRPAAERCTRYSGELRIRVANPVTWASEEE